MSQFPPQPTQPVMLKLSADESMAWQKAHNWAYASIVAGIRKLKDGKSAEYEDWFEYNWPWTDQMAWLERRDLVIRNLTQMANKMCDPKPMCYEKSADVTNCKLGDVGAERWAFTPVNNNTIFLCPYSFNVDWLRFWYFDSEEWARAFIVAHEMYHAAVDRTATDVEYSDRFYKWFAVKSLHNFHPHLAVRNAQNYAYFAMGIGWTRPTEAPLWQADYGIWGFHAQDADWGNVAGGPAIAKATDADIVLCAYREPTDQGGRLWSRAVVMDGDRPKLQQARLLNPLSSSMEIGDFVSVVTPALAADGGDFYCAYVDERLGVVILKAHLGHPSGTGDELDYRWEDLSMPSVSPMINPDKMATPSPAFAVYRTPRGGVSCGLYCVYTDREGRLRCVVKLDERFSRWGQVPFDQDRSTDSLSSPSLVIFDGQLKCGYFDDKHRYRLLHYIPATKASHFHDAAAGTWKEDAHAPPDLSADANEIALGQLDTPEGPRLVAIGNMPGKKDTLSYALYSESTGWAPLKRLTTLASTHRPALAQIGSGLHVFCRKPDGTLESRWAN